MENELEILEKPNWSKRQLDEIREYIFEIKNKIREKKSSVFNNEPFVIDIKPKREETLKTLQLFTSYEIGVIHPDNNIHWDIDVDSETYTLKDFAFENKNIYLIFRKGE